MMAAVFSPTYAQARQRFLDAAAARGLPVQTHPLQLPGIDGETLATDVVIDGDPDAPLLVMTTSACHGVEGYAGSAIQAGLLRRGGPPRGVAVLHVHAVNPHGFSFGRRVTQENVDLNRNFISFRPPLPDNPGYAQIHDLLLPASWPPSPVVEQSLADFREHAGPRGWPTACISAASVPRGATRCSVGCCASRWRHAVTWPGSTCIPAWARAAWASASSLPSTKARHSIARGAGGASG
jgi:hypothetical protein